MRLLPVALLLFTVCAIQSCKEGCKDKTALNYDSKATAENGTCLYCKDVFTGDTATYFFSSFNNPQNPNASAIEFIVVTTNSNISGNGCKSIGKQATSGCDNYLTMVNLTSEHIQGSFDVEYLQNGAEGWFFSESNFVIKYCTSFVS